MSVYTKTIDSAKEGVSALAHYENPVITKELRTRMRAGRAHWTMLAYVLLLGIVVFAIYYDVWLDSISSGGIANWAQRRVGFNMFNYLTWIQFVLLSLIGPSLTAGALTLEMEQQTLEMLSLTTLSPRNVVVGKAGSGTLFCWMLLACSLPLAGMCLMFGGISPVEIAITYVLLAVWSFTVCATSVFWSSLVTKTSVASLLSYGSVIVYAPLISAIPAPGYFGGGYTEMVLGALNPAWAASKALATAQVFHIPVPLALVSFLVNGTIGILLLTSAQTHLKYHKTDKALAVRLMLLGLTGLVLLLLLGNMAMMYTTLAGATKHSMSRIFATVIVSIIMSLIYVFTPVFATGVVRCGSGMPALLAYLLSGLNPKRIFSQDLRGAMPFMVIWLAICTAIGAAALVSIRAVDLVPEFLAIMVSAAAVMLAYCSVGIFASVAAPNRNLAIVLTLLFIIITFVIYPVILSNYQWGEQKYSIKYELAYLWPALPVSTMNENYKSDALGPTLAVDPHLHWFVVSLCYLLISYGFLQAAAIAKNRYRGLVDE